MAAAMCLAMLAGCGSYTRHLRPSGGDVNCIRQFAPHLTNNLYSAYVDVTKHHFSGLLLFKEMPDSSFRVVFTNEMGVKFFDFAFLKDGSFVKYYVLKKMDKKVVVNALRKDIELALMRSDLSDATMLTDGSNNYVTLPDKRGHDCYITDNTCNRLLRIEKTSHRRAIEDIQFFNCANGVPDSIDIRHKNFKFTIALKKIER
jgi:hypothetical protein